MRLLLILFFVVLVIPAFSQSPPLNQTYEAMPLSEIQRGMQGIGFSVFNGLEVVSFEFEVVGVAANQGGYNSYVIALLRGANLEYTGVQAGMSGSPVYIDGKIIGAVAATFPLQKDPYAIIRPIEEMLATQDLIHIEYPNQSLEFIPLEDGMASTFYASHEQPFTYQFWERVAAGNVTDATMVPIRTPLYMAGFSDSVLQLFKNQLELYGYIPVVSGSMNLSAQPLPDEVSDELNPGDPVGIQFIGGDISAEAIGTVTWRSEDRILLFGHRAFQRGLLEAPLTKAFIYTVVPSLNLSFKMGRSIKVVGKTVGDFEAAVVGQLGAFAKTIPVSMQATKGDQSIHYDYTVIKDPLFFPNSMASAVLMAMAFFQPANELDTIQIKASLSVRNKDTQRFDVLTFEDFWTGSVSQKNLIQLFMQFIQQMQQVVYNPFSPVDVELVDIQITIRPDFNYANIEQLRVLSTDIRPGDDVPIEIVFQNYKKETLVHRETIHIPEGVDASAIYLGVGSAKHAEARERSRAAALFTPHSYEELIELLNRDTSFNHLVIWLELQDLGLVVNGRALPGLPSSQFVLYGSLNQTDSAMYASRTLKSYETNFLVNGWKMMPLAINPNPHYK